MKSLKPGKVVEKNEKLGKQQKLSRQTEYLKWGNKNSYHNQFHIKLNQTVSVGRAMYFSFTILAVLSTHTATHPSDHASETKRKTK